MRATPVVLLCIGGTLAIAGCGNDGAAPAAPPPKARLPLASQAKGPGEVLVRGEASPTEAGPYEFDGRYTVRFEQVAPEDPSVDFAGETPFVARLLAPGEHGRGRRLFRAAAAHGERTVTIRGRYLVSVDFGDWPYALRFTPRR